MCVLEFTDVHRGYGQGDVLTALNLQVRQGEVIGLLGRNGAGKTTLIRLVMGMLIPNKGTVKVFGEDPRKDPVATRKRIGYVAEDQELPPFLKAREVIAMYRDLYPNWDEKFAADLMQRFELPPDRKIKDLSRGQARQVALLCAVSHRPDLLILDEPAGGLDPAARREFMETSIRLLNEGGTTILFSSHHMTDVERMASRLVMIHEKQKWIDSDLDDIREGYCLAQLPGNGSIDGPRLLTIPQCLCARRHGDALHAVFELDPESCAQKLRSELGGDIEPVQCRSIKLEEMFIELAGRQS
jgi:ABC-type multidrug transport system ATPase subunit